MDSKDIFTIGIGVSSSIMNLLQGIWPETFIRENPWLEWLTPEMHLFMGIVCGAATTVYIVMLQNKPRAPDVYSKKNPWGEK